MKKNIKRIFFLIIICLLTTMLLGCNLVQLNSEKDMKTVIGKIQGTEILKKDFICQLTYYQMMYRVQGYSFPIDDELKQLKEDILNSIVEIEVLKEEALKNNITIEASEIEESYNENIEYFKENFQQEEDYNNFIEKNNITTEEFESYYKRFIEDILYVNKFTEQFKIDLTENNKDEMSKVVVEIDGNKLLKDEFYYNLSSLEFYYFTNYGQGLPTDEESLKSIYDSIKTDMTENYLLRLKGTNDKIILDQSKIDEKTNELINNYNAIFQNDEEIFKSFLGQYFLTIDQFKKQAEIDAKSQLYREAIEKNIAKDITVTNEEIKEYYDSHLTSYDESTVSAKHILVDSKELADEIYNKTKTKDFDNLMEEYKDSEGVLETADLGSFSFGKMVTEFSTAAFDMEIGDISKPVQTQFGYHIIYVYEKNVVPTPTLNDKKDEIIENIKDTKISDKFNEMINQLIEEAKIKKYDIDDPFESFLEEKKKEYNVKIYMNRI